MSSTNRGLLHVDGSLSSPGAERNGRLHRRPRYSSTRAKIASVSKCSDPGLLRTAPARRCRSPWKASHGSVEQKTQVGGPRRSVRLQRRQGGKVGTARCNPTADRPRAPSASRGAQVRAERTSSCNGLDAPQAMSSAARFKHEPACRRTNRPTPPQPAIPRTRSSIGLLESNVMAMPIAVGARRQRPAEQNSNVAIPRGVRLRSRCSEPHSCRAELRSERFNSPSFLFEPPHAAAH